MKCSQLFRLLKCDAWYVVSQKGFHVKMRHHQKSGILIFRNNENQEIQICN